MVLLNCLIVYCTVIFILKINEIQDCNITQIDVTRLIWDGLLYVFAYMFILPLFYILLYQCLTFICGFKEILSAIFPITKNLFIRSQEVN